jgi:hypothetical protein
MKFQDSRRSKCQKCFALYTNTKHSSMPEYLRDNSNTKLYCQRCGEELIDACDHLGGAIFGEDLIWHCRICGEAEIKEGLSLAR